MATDQINDVKSTGVSSADEDDFLTALAASCSVIRDSFDFWKSNGWPERLPMRDDLNPFDVPKLMPHMLLLDVLNDPRDYCYRLIGTAIGPHLAQDWTGVRMSEIEHQRQPSQIWDNCDRVVHSMQPRLGRTPYVGPHADFLYAEDLILPLGDGGDGVGKLLVFAAYIGKDRLRGQT